jgi:glycosyltransferase involved in cell wall biosynthesis
VVFDARWYFRGPPSGHLVTVEVLRRLAESVKDNQLTLLMNGTSGERGALQSEFPSAKVIRVANWTMLGTAVGVVPWVLLFTRADVFIGQNFCPPFGARHRWLFVYDAIFLRRPELFSRRERAYLGFLRPLARRAHYIYTISQTERRELCASRLAPSGRIGVFYLAARAEFRDVPTAAIGEVRERLGLPPRYLLCLGRVNVRKNIGVVMEAADQSERVTPECPLVLAGPPDGAQDSDLESRAKALGTRLVRLGFVEQSMVPGLVAGASALISMSEVEGFGLPPVEAMASGTAVIAADAPIAREVLGEGAFLVNDVHDVGEVARAIDRVLGDDDLRDRLVAAGLKVAAGYSWKASVASLWNDIERTRGCPAVSSRAVSSSRMWWVEHRSERRRSDPHQSRDWHKVVRSERRWARRRSSRLGP